MSWNENQEIAIIEALTSNAYKNRDEMTKALLRKRVFSGKTDRGIIAKAKSLSNEALLQDHYLIVPPPAPKAPKLTAAQKRVSLFAKIPKLTDKQKATAAVADAIKEAKEKIATRKAAAKKAKATRNKNRTMTQAVRKVVSGK